MFSRFWIHLADIALCLVTLRIILGWLWAFPRLLRLIITLFLIVGAVFLINFLQLPLAGLLVLLLIVPATIIIFLSFLPELSRVYQTAIRGNLFRGRVMQSEETLSEVASALEQLASERKGAILVFPGLQDAENLISGGEEVDCSIKRSLLRSIFDPNCPRHDGAAVLRNNRIVRIGAVLPLASAEGAEAKLGTRHLAALGLSERADADVLVVSEERGTVSHAREGNLRELSPLTQEGLEEHLINILGMRRERVHERRAVAWSAILWLTALVLSISGSFVVQNLRDKYLVETPVLTGAEARIQFVEVPKEYYVDGLAVQSCILQLRSPRNIPIPRNLTVNVDLSRTAPGAVSLNLSPEMVTGLPKEMAVERIDPPRLNFVLERSRMLDISIEPGPVTGLSKEWGVASISVQPNVLQAVVRDRTWKATDRLLTLPIDLSAVTAPGPVNIAAQPLNIPASIEPANQGSGRSVRVLLEIVPRAQRVR
ncbi:MAG: DNA integrity scanning protein DisA nucleotide-binding domain protein [Candidatus Methylacidiphilales bacterium]|nr:DNA integrity scanning protein DisA nucleotide-binding domain protein [Candidatus Methylacidiphilales bacterium]